MRLHYVAFFLLFISASQSARAEHVPPRVELSVEAPFLSRYAFRGKDVYDHAVVTPDLTLSFKPQKSHTFSLETWALGSLEGKTDYSEFRYDARYARLLGPASVYFAHRWYVYPHDQNDAFKSTREAYVGISLDALLTPTFTFYKDLEETHARYLELSFHNDLDAAEWHHPLPLQPFLTFGFGRSAEEVYDDNGLAHIVVGTKLKLHLTDEILIQPLISYNMKFDRETKNMFWIGVTLSYDVVHEL